MQCAEPVFPEWKKDYRWETIIGRWVQAASPLFPNRWMKVKDLFDELALQ